MGQLGQFDLVFSPFVMSYAKDRQELLAMCRALYQNLKPGGRPLSMNDNPSLLPDSETGYSKYGKDYWARFLEHPLLVFIVARRP